MKYFIFSLLATITGFFVPDPANSDETKRLNDNYRGNLILEKHFKYNNLKLTGDVTNAMRGLEYESGQLPYVYAEDLNNDGFQDYLLGSYQGKLCGSAGCPYTLLDGKSLKIIGEFFGEIALLNNKINGFPVIQILSKRDIEQTNLQTYVFDGLSYQEVSYALLEGSGVEQWHRHVQELP